MNLLPHTFSNGFKIHGKTTAKYGNYQKNVSIFISTKFDWQLFYAVSVLDSLDKSSKEFFSMPLI